MTNWYLSKLKKWKGLQKAIFNMMSVKDYSVQFSYSVMSDFLWLHGLQHTRPPCLSTTPRVYLDSCPLSQWCHPTIWSSFIPFSCIKRPKYWSFSFSIRPSNEHPGLIFRMDWLDLLAVQGTLKSLLQHHSSKPSILHHSAFFTSNSHIHTWPLEKP